MSCLAALGLWIGVTLATASEPPDAAALVRQVRAQEAWIDRVKTLRIRAVEDWERTPKGLERLRRQHARDFPGSKPENDPDLRPHWKWYIDVAYDQSRIRLRVQDEGYSDDLRIWDGKRYFLQNRYDLKDWPDVRGQDGTLISGQRQRFDPWSYFTCFRAGTHAMWWYQPEERAANERMTPRPEDFAYEGRADFHGFECHVVSHWDSWTSLYIGVVDGRLHGMRSGAQTTKKLKRSLVELLREAGHAVADEQDMERQAATITPQERARMSCLGAARMTRLIDPCFEFRLSLNKEIAPGCRLPLVQAVRFFEVDENGDAFESQSNELRILEIKLDEPLPDALFAVTIKPGERVIDQIKNPPSRRQFIGR
jgi:hypothetical protein